MTNPERDMLIIGLSLGLVLGGSLGAWLGYRVGRWVAWRVARAHQRASGLARRDAKHIPFGDLAEQDARRVMSKPRVIPLTPKRKVVYTDVRDPSKVDPIPLPVAPLSQAGADELVAGWRDAWPGAARISDAHWSDPSHPANATAREIRANALAALTGAGYKRRDAEAALDACTLAERAGGLESWVAAALRHAAAKKP